MFLLQVHHVDRFSPTQKQLNDANHQEEEQMTEARHAPIISHAAAVVEGKGLSTLKKAEVRENFELTG